MISVLMPLYNKERYLERTVTSVIRQTYEDWELIIVDDGSTDSSLHKLKRLKLGFEPKIQDRIKILSHGNRGAASARVAAFKNSVGNLVALLDADDFWAPSKLRKQFDYLGSNPKIELVLTNYCLFFDFNDDQRKIKSKLIKLPNEPEKLVNDWLTTVGDGGLVESTGLFRRSYLESLLDSSGSNMTAGLEMCIQAQRDQKLGLLNEFLCGYTRSLDGWHENKVDLIHSYSRLTKSIDFPEEMMGKVSSGLKCHLALWRLRREKFPRNLRVLLSLLDSNGLSTIIYIQKTLKRILLRNIRDFQFLKPSNNVSSLRSLWVEF